MKKTLLSLSLFATICMFAQAPSLQWTKTINGNKSSQDEPIKTCKDASGNVYITGWNSDANVFIVKFDNNGNQVYEAIYDGPDKAWDQSFDILADNSGNAYICGSASIPGNYYAPMVVKYNATGTKVWEHISALSNSSSFNSISFDNASNPTYLYAAGGVYYGDSMLVEKISISTGASIWGKKLESGKLSKVKTDNNGNPYVCGYTGANYALQNTDGYIAKMNANGNLVWKQTFNGLADSSDEFNNIEILSGGGVIAAGSVRDSATNIPWVKYMRISSTGQIVWNKTFHVGSWMNIQTDMVANSTQSAFYITFYLKRQTGFLSSTPAAYILAADANGNTIFTNSFVDSLAWVMNPANVKVDNYGEIYVIGYRQSSSTGNSGFLWKTHPSGITACTINYTTLFTSGSVSVADAIGLVIDNANHPLGVFKTSTGVTSDDASLVQFSSACSINWEVFYNGHGNSMDFTSGIVVDNAGNSYVGGFIINDNTGVDGVIAKYDSYGNQLWSNLFDTGINQDWSNGFGMDAQDNLYIVSGTSGVGNASLAKYDSAGNQLWVAATTIPADHLAIDAGSNSIYIAGGTYGVINTSNDSREFSMALISNTGVTGPTHVCANNPWFKTWAKSVTIDNNSNLFVAGTVQKDTNIYIGNILLQKFNSAAQSVGYLIVPGIDSLYLNGYADVAKVIYNPNDGFLYLAGSAKPQGGTHFSQYLLQINPTSLAVNWTKIYNDTNKADYTVYDMIVSSANEIYVTGGGINSLDGYFYVQKWDNSGNLLWERTFSHATSTYDYEMGRAITLDNLGNVYATGTLGPTGFIPGAYRVFINTVKITPSGTVLWKKAFETYPDNYVYGQYIAVKNNRVYIGGNVLDAGQAQNSDIGVLKYCDIADPLLSSTGTVSICNNSSYAIAAPLASSYQWNSGATSQSITATTAGNYYCTVYQGDGCYKNSDTLHVNVVSAPVAPNICMVTVDSTSAHNIIYWDKTPFANAGVIGFNIYREDLTNVYTMIASVPFTNLSEYTDIDPNANPNTTTKRYKISAVDTCGNESAKSNYHNTIYIVSNGSGQFSWNQLYSIENNANPVSQYLLLRDNYNTGSWQQIASTAGTQFNINDINFTTFQPTANWRVVTSWSISCTPTAKTGNGTQSAIVRSKSNITNNRVAGINQLAVGSNQVTVYPNPAQNSLTINVPSSTKTTIKLMSLVGEEIIATDLFNENSTQLDISKLASGVYLLEVSNNTGKFVKKIVKE